MSEFVIIHSLRYPLLLVFFFLLLSITFSIASPGFSVSDMKAGHFLLLDFAYQPRYYIGHPDRF